MQKQHHKKSGNLYRFVCSKFLFFFLVNEIKAGIRHQTGRHFNAAFCLEIF